MTKLESSKVVAILMAAFPHSQVTAKTGEVYENMLADLEFAVVEAAIARLIRSAKFLPTVADIRAAAVETSAGRTRLGADAWGDVLLEIRRIGSYGTPRFKDPIVEHCVACMGWRNLCRSENDAADRARFIELYDGTASRYRADTVAGALLPDTREGLRKLQPEPGKWPQIPDRVTEARRYLERADSNGLLSRADQERLESLKRGVVPALPPKRPFVPDEVQANGQRCARWEP